MKVMRVPAIAAGVAYFLGLSQAIELDTSSPQSIHDACAIVAHGLMDYYQGNKYGGTVGMFTSPYYWWHAGAAFGSLIDFWYLTGDETYNEIVKEGMLYQVGEGQNYLPANQSTTEGNDDQGFWGITAMAAAERNFSNPGPKEPGWLYLAQAVFNTMAARWDKEHCGGGLRWQIYTWNAGYDYKNTVSNGCLMNLAARLARYTGNTTYIEWAEKIYDWLVDVDFLWNATDPVNIRLYDGAGIVHECKDHSWGEWTYNYGLLMSSYAYLYDVTNHSKVWEDRATLLWGRAKVFFRDGIMYEAACQRSDEVFCNNDQRCFRGIFARFLGHTALFMESLRTEVMDLLETSSRAAAKSCTGGSDGKTCGLNWFKGAWDGYYGLGEQMCALETMQNLRVLDRPLPLTADTGGTSNGSADAGLGKRTLTILDDDVETTGGDRAGAGVVTVVFLLFLATTGAWMLS